MAGGIDWFRWHHGSVTDPKFALVARRAGASLPDVLAVWAYLLEKASAATERGSFGEVDAEALDCLFNFPSTETRTANIIEAMRERHLLEDDRVVAWLKRQPKREREGDSSTDRVRTFRAKTGHETPRNAKKRQETPREEESREEEKNTPPPPCRGEPATGGGFARFWSAWPAHQRKAVRHQCWAKWKAKGLEALADRIVAAVEAAKRSEAWVKDGGEFIPAPLTWLNQARWEAPTEAEAADAAAPPWDTNRSTVETMALSLGLGRWSETEPFDAYKARVRRAAERHERTAA